MTFPKIVLLAQAGSSHSEIVYGYFSTRLPIEHVIYENPESRTLFLRRRLKRLGVRTVLGQVLFRSLAVPLLRLRSRRRRADLMKKFDLHNLTPPPSQVTRVSSVNSDEAIARLAQLRPDVVVVQGTRIIQERVLRSIDSAFINLHAGITPAYRGVHGAYWALVERNAEACGVTAHLLDPGIDTGPIVGQALITPTAADNFATYPLLQLAVGLPLMERAVHAVMNGTLTILPPNSPRSALWSHPTLVEYCRYRIARGVR